MNDLISRSALIGILQERLQGQSSQNTQAKMILHEQVATAIEVVEAAQAVDAEPVVRCGECTHRGDPDICPWSYKEWRADAEGGWQWTITDHTVHNGFCHRGSKKTGGAGQ